MIVQMVIDIGSNSKKQTHKKSKIDAKNYIFNDGEGLLFVCEIAEIQPLDVRREAKAIIKRGYTINPPPEIPKKAEVYAPLIKKMLANGKMTKDILQELKISTRAYYLWKKKGLLD